MIGLDTNVLLRWLLLPEEGEVGSKSAEIEAEIEKVSAIILSPGARFFVNVIVIAEVAWILEQKLRLKRKMVNDVVDRLLYSINITVGNAAQVRAAQLKFMATTANFADCLIAQLNLDAGCRYTLTFDRKAGKGSGFRHVDAL